MNNPSFIETMFGNQSGIPLLSWHLNRVFDTLISVGKEDDFPIIKDKLEQLGFVEPTRVRVVYNDAENIKVESYPFQHSTDPWSIQLIKIDQPLSDGRKTFERSKYDEIRSVLSQNEEAILVGPKGRVLEGTITNIFVKINGKWVTPGFQNNLVKGVMREAILSQFDVIEKDLNESDLQIIEDVFLTNALRGVVLVKGGGFKSGQGAESIQKMVHSLYFNS